MSLPFRVRVRGLVRIGARALLALWVMSGHGSAGEGGAPATGSAARERPLFSPTRRPAPPVRPIAAAPRTLAAPPPAPPPPPPQVRISGIILGTEKQLVILSGAGQAASVAVGVGSLVEGWTVASISARTVVLRRDDRSVTLSLPEPRR